MASPATYHPTALLPINPPEGMRDVQKRMLCAIDSRHQGIFAKYGIGKTWMTLARGLHLRNGNAHLGMVGIILCRPRNILTWRREIAARYPSITVYEGVEGMNRLLAVPHVPSHAVLLMPWHSLARNVKSLIHLARLHVPAMIAADESTAIKNPKAQMTQAALELSAQTPWADHLALSGNPMPERPYEIWSQFLFCYGARSPLGTSYYQFLRTWFLKTDYSYVLKFDLIDRFYNLLAQWAVYPTQEELALLQATHAMPQYTLEFYEETESQRTILNYLFENWALPQNFAGQDLSAEDIAENLKVDPAGMDGQVDIVELNHTLSLAQKAQQIASGFYYPVGKDSTPVYFGDNPKLNLYKDIVKQLLEEDPQRQIITWHRYAAEVEMLMTALDSLGVFAVAGPAEEALIAFADGPLEKRPRVILMPVGVSQGFNELAGADTAIWYSNSYSQEMRDQAEARNAGLRQRFPLVTFIDLASSRQSDLEIISALQAKNLTPARLATIINRYAKKRKANPNG